MTFPREKYSATGALAKLNGKNKSAIVAACACAFFAAPSQAEPVKAAPSDSVLMFVAAWCAPCLQELARFEILETAAKPRWLLIVTIDEGRRSSEMTRRFTSAQKLNIAPADAGELLQRLSGGKAAGLPYAVMTGKDGKPCATRNVMLTEGALRAMADSCMR